MVTRAARRIGSGEIEAALKRALELQHGLEARTLSISFDSPPAGLVLAPDASAALTVEDLAFDRRNHRVSASVRPAEGAAERRPALRVSGTVVETAEVAVVSRALARGDTLQASDFILERRLKQALPSDAQPIQTSLAGQVARRPLPAGSIIRAGDFGKPEVVARGEVVTAVYEIPGLILTLRVRANEAGAQGDTIAVLNTQSKKTLQATVSGPGKVTVSGSAIGRLAANDETAAKP
jgi:flagella basal body P-ring formation protein FlgA